MTRSLCLALAIVLVAAPALRADRAAGAPTTPTAAPASGVTEAPRTTGTAPAAAAPAAAAPAPRSPLAALGWLAGRWEGAGWTEHAGARHQFRGSERVEARLDGEALVIEGIHFAVMPDGQQRKVHHALAVLAVGPEGELRFETFLGGGRGGEFPARLDGETLIWEIPDRQMRYEIWRDEQGRWVERGTVPGSGGERREVFGMVLQRLD